MRASPYAISVIIPAFNRRHDITRAIASALAQTRQPDEIIVVDDASTDGTVDAIEALREPRIRILRHARNRGAAAARNTGIEAAKGEWIALLDSDDEWDEHKLERQLASLANAPADTLAGVTGYLIEDHRNGETRRFQPTPREVTLDRLLLGCALSIGSTLLARRDVFAEIGLIDSELPRLEDWEWLMRYLAKYRLDALPDILTTVHKSGDPSFKQVSTAVARIRARHREAWYRRSWVAGRKFDSTLLVEEAAACYFVGNFRGAATLSLRAILAYPFRGGDFFAMLARRALRLGSAKQRKAG